MSKIFLKFGDIEIKKRKFHSFKSPITIDGVDINRYLTILPMEKMRKKKMERMTLSISSATKMMKRLMHYTSNFQN